MKFTTAAQLKDLSREFVLLHEEGCWWFFAPRNKRPWIGGGATIVLSKEATIDSSGLLRIFPVQAKLLGCCWDKGTASYHYDTRGLLSEAWEDEVELGIATTLAPTTPRAYTTIIISYPIPRTGHLFPVGTKSLRSYWDWGTAIVEGHPGMRLGR